MLSNYRRIDMEVVMMIVTGFGIVFGGIAAFLIWEWFWESN